MANGYRVYLDGVLLPVTPEKIELKVKSKNKKIVLLNEGEINLLKSPGLSEIKFEFLLPSQPYPFAIYENGPKTVNYYLDKLEELKVNKKAFRFIISRLSPSGELLHNTNMKVAIEDYSIIEDVKKYGLDTGVKIELRQYRDYGTKVLSISADGETASITEIRSSRDINEFHIVRADETLYEIAKKEYGDGEKYTEIMELNNLPNPNNIEVGQVLRLV